MAVHLIQSDLEFILRHTIIAERHAAGEDLLSLHSNTLVPLGLWTVDGMFNNVVPGQENFGVADELFPRLTDPVFRPAEDDRRLTHGPRPEPVRYALTDREIEAMTWVAQGKSSADIAILMHVSERTVNFHVNNVIQKLGVATRIQAAIRCVVLGLIDS
jgi:DNA-binding CsgD family transcriptional regulator